MADYRSNATLSMRDSAARRVREMQRKADENILRTQALPPMPLPFPSPQPDPIAALLSPHNEEESTTSTEDAAKQNRNEQSLLLFLILILMQEHADSFLILALMYLALD